MFLYNLINVILFSHSLYRMKISYEQENPCKDMLLVNQFEPFYERMRSYIVIVQAQYNANQLKKLQKGKKK